jgi:hypothetical protein
MCTSFKAELAQALHNFTNGTGDVFNLALYTAGADLGAHTTEYTVQGEASGTNYSAGGISLQNITPTYSGTTGYWSFENATFNNVTLSCNGALIYNANNMRAVCVLNFGFTITKNASDLVIVFPPMGAQNSILRIA